MYRMYVRVYVRIYSKYNVMDRNLSGLEREDWFIWEGVNQTAAKVLLQVLEFHNVPI